MKNLIEQLDKKLSKDVLDELRLAEGCLAEATKAVDDCYQKIYIQRLKQIRSEPLCPECGVQVLRPKCLHELGSECPRHDLIAQLGGRTRLADHLAKRKQKSKSK